MKVSLNHVSAAHPAAAAGVLAIQGLTLEIAAGEQLAIIGPSGAGKTTLLQLMACAIKPSAGTFTLAEQSPWQLSTAKMQALRGQLFLAPQAPPLPPRQRVVTAVAAALLPRMSLWQAIKQLLYPVHAGLVHRALDAFNVADKLFERVDRLSGGERQRVGLARCVLACESNGARLLLVDEPLSALDPTRAAQALAALQQAATQQQATLVCSLHQVDMALAYFPRIVALRHGALVFDCAAKDVTPAMLQDLYGDAVPSMGAVDSEPPDLLVQRAVATPPHCR